MRYCSNAKVTGLIPSINAVFYCSCHRVVHHGAFTCALYSHMAAQWKFDLWLEVHLQVQLL